MNFQYIPPVESSKDLLDLAFRKAREKGKSKKLVGNWLQIIRKKEGMKLDIIKDNLVTKLEKILDDFPGIDSLSDFYIKLMKLTLDYSEYKKSCGAVSWAVKKIRELHRNYVRMVVKEKDRSEINNITKQFYGRISSFLKQIEPNMKYLEKCRKIMRTYPDIKEMFTVCIYGFPNVGKSTLLNKLAKTKAEVAAYAFTTKSINCGHISINDKEIQILDVPGTLARKEKMNNIEQQAELVMKELADVVIYVFDLSEACGYTVEMQKLLFKNLGNNKPVLVYLSKTDIIDKNVVGEFKHKHYSIDEIKKELKHFLTEV